MRQEKRDLWVGVFVLVALILAIALPVAQRRMSEPQYTLFAEFDDMGGLETGSPVKFRGYNVGTVEEISFNPDPGPGECYFLMRLGIRQSIPVFKGTVAQAKGASPIGEKYVDLVVVHETPNRLPVGARIPGSTGSGMDKAIAGLPDMFDRITRMSDRIGNVNWQPTIHGMGDDVRKIRSDFERLSYSIRRTMQFSDSLLANTNDRMGKLTASLDRSIRESNDVLDNVAAMISDNNGRLAEALETTNTSLNELTRFLTHVDSLATTNKDEIGEIVRNINEATSSLKDLVKHPLKAFTGGVK